MIRPRWLAQAKALSPAAAPQTRLLSTSIAAAFNGPSRSSGDDSQWTIPGIKAAKTTATTISTTFTPPTFNASKPKAPKPNDEFAQWRKPRAQSPTPAKLSPHKQTSRKRAGREISNDDSLQRHMLVVKGLSPSLRPSDFARLAARDLSDWSSGINEGPS